MRMYTEGKAKIRDSGKAFLNPKGKASRDLSVAYVSHLAKKGSSLVDATSATGIRGIRYALESGIRNPTLLEINQAAYKAAKANILLNKVKAVALNTSIQEFANTGNGRFDFIDLDPFGGITPYVYDIMKISGDGTRLMVTATDTAVLCGADSKACIKLYDSKPIHNELCHEGGMRVMIGYIARVAAQFDIGINVELSVSYLHYMRSFIRLTAGANAAYASIAKMGYLNYCDKCRNRETERGFISKNSVCSNCKGKMAAYGKMWMGELKDQKLADALCRSIKGDDGEEASKLLETIKSELDIPFYYHIPTLTKRYKIGSVSPYAVADKLSEVGYKASLTHMKSSAIKTDASLKEVVSAIKGGRLSPV
jgi:tRNA (guanine26-N2/guanine27-N2)-dimethyltransferase